MTSLSRCGVTPTEITDSLHALGLLANVKVLDRYWTAEAISRATSPGPPLGPVVEHLIELLGALATVAPKVAGTSVRNAEHLQPRFAEVLGRRPQRVRDLVERETGVDIAKSAEHVAGLLVSRLGVEADLLRQENRRIEEGRTSDGDISAQLDGCLDVLGIHLEVHIQVPSVETAVAGVLAVIALL